MRPMCIMVGSNKTSADLRFSPFVCSFLPGRAKKNTPFKHKENTMHDSSIKNLVQAQFGAVAERYVTSAIHAHGSDLARMIELAQPRGDERLLDIATGGGHTALAF